VSLGENMSHINDRVKSIVERFNQYKDWEDRYQTIIDLGKALPSMPEEYKTEENKVKGCQSQVWLFATLEGDKVKIYADSDATIVKGLVALLVEVYSLSTPDEILMTKPTFLEEIGLREHLSMSRANGLNAMLKQISLYALGYKVKLQQQ
jgi:cysteine desulfuration protein SufE